MMTKAAISYWNETRVAPWKRMRPAMRAERRALCPRITGPKATDPLLRNPRPPARSGWVGVSRRSRRETRQRNRPQMKRRKYQRMRRNWKMGMLTWMYHWPATVRRRLEAAEIAYQLDVLRE